MDNSVALIKAYTEPHRYYHTLDHITNMFMVARDHLIELTEAQILAIWWHDFVYNPRSKTNEFDSVVQLHEMVLIDPSPALTKMVAVASTIILDTVSHVASAPESGIVLDLDLCGLGSDNEVFSNNTVLLRHEFSHLTDLEWITGRADWIAKFLNKPRIFSTDWGYNTFEHNARHNLYWELESYTQALNNPIAMEDIIHGFITCKRITHQQYEY